MALQLPGGGLAPANYQYGPEIPRVPGTGQVTSYPDYNAIIERLMAPLRARLTAQQQALAAQTQFQGNLARDNSRLNQEGLDQANTQALKSIVDHLQANGLISSGDTHYRSHEQKVAYQRATDQQANQLLSVLTNLQTQLEEAARQAAEAEQSGLINAQDYAATNYSPNTHSYAPFAPDPLSRSPVAGRVDIRKLLGF